VETIPRSHRRSPGEIATCERGDRGLAERRTGLAGAMRTRRRLALLAVLTVLWLSFVAVVLLSHWHGSFVAVGAVIAVALLFVTPARRSEARRPPPSSPDAR
jgi:Flp pilus assembly protein TadB